MNIDTILVPIIFLFTILGLIKFQNRTSAVFGVTLLVLLATGTVTRDQLLTSIANPGLLTLILLILCSAAIEKTRFLRSVAAKLIVKSYSSTQVRLIIVTSLFSAILNNTAVVAALLSPIRNNRHHFASKLLLPLSYAAILGGTLTLIGTSTNLIVNSLYIDATGQSLSFFSFTAVGALIVTFCGITLLIFSRWLPEVHNKDQTVKGYLIDAEITEGSELIGRSVEDNGLRHLESLFLVEVIRQEQLISPVSPTEVLQVNDRLIFSGDITKVMQLSQFSGLETFADNKGLLDSNLTEVVVRQESVLVGTTLKLIGFRALFDAAVVAIKREGERVSGKLGDVRIRAGDILILAIGTSYRNSAHTNNNFIDVSGVEADTCIKGWKAWLSTGGFLVIVILAVFGMIDLLIGLVLLLGALIFSQSLSTNEVIRRFPLEIWIIVSSAVLLSHALVNAGVVDLISYWVNSAASSDDAYLALILVYLITWILTELVTNNAAAAIMFPIGYSIALGFGVSILPFIMIVAFAASGSFISPYGYQTNLMVFSAGQYNIKDFVKLGLPVSIVYGVVVLCSVPLFFPF